jgi:hypothetical protein
MPAAGRTLALACTLPVLAASTADARPVHDAAPPATDHGSTTIVQVSAPRGFDWGDAAIGAAAGIATSVIAIAGMRTAARRRDHNAPTSAGATH